MSVAYQLPDFLEFVFLLTAFYACKFANSQRASFTLFLPHTSTLYITIFCGFLCRFYSIYCAVLYFIISQRFSLYISAFFL